MSGKALQRGDFRLCPALGAGVPVEFPAVAGGRNKAGADAVIAEMLAVRALARIGRQDGVEGRDNGSVVQILGVKLGHARAVEGGAEIEVVAAGTLADQGDLREIGPRAAV